MLQSIFATFEAAGTITEYAAVKLNSDNKIIVSTTAVEPSIIGIAQSAGTTGDMFNV